MPIYEVIKKDTHQVMAVKANNKAQALSFVTADMFTAEPMKAEEVVSYMEAGNTVTDATPKAEGNVTPLSEEGGNPGVEDMSGEYEQASEDARIAGENHDGQPEEEPSQGGA